jgi:hypothetical protein
MELSWYRAVALAAGPNEPPYLTNENIKARGVYSADGPDGIGDQYFQGLEHMGETQATWLVANSFPAEVDAFLQLPIASIRILSSEVVWATVRVEAVEPVGAWMTKATLGDKDGINSVHPDFLAEQPLRRAVRSWPASEPHVWLNTKGPFNPLRSPNALRAVLSMPSVEGRRFLIVTWLQEVCYLVHDR